MSGNLPTIGAAMTVSTLERLHNWIREGERDLELQDFISATTLEGDFSPLVDRAKTLLDGYTGRLGIHGPFWGFTIDSPDPDIRAVVKKRLGQGLDVCAALGATQMVVHSPFTTWDYNNLDGRRNARARKLDFVHQTLDNIVARAADMGVTLVVENIEDKDPTARVELAKSFNSSAIAVSIDTGHAHYAHGSTGAPPVDHYVRLAGDMLQHVHVQDADGYGDRHWTLGEGTIRWSAVFSALAELDHSPRLVLELADHDQILEAYDWLTTQNLAR